MRRHSINFTLLLMVALTGASMSQAKGDDFNSVVKMIEQFYNVKHQGIPFVAKAAMKVVGVGAKIKGGEAKRFAEAGSFKVATFEDQEFNGNFLTFRRMLNETMDQSWMPFVQTTSATDRDQNYIFVREKGDKFTVLVIVIEPTDASVVQATVCAKNFALLMKDPEEGAKAITQEATILDNE